MKYEYKIIVLLINVFVINILFSLSKITFFLQVYFTLHCVDLLQ